MSESLLRRLRGEPDPPREYWAVSWSHDSDKSNGVFQYFRTEREARAFAARLGVDPARGYVQIRDVTPET